MKVFRIALEQFGATAKDAFSGQSGYCADGRWHTRSRFLDYAAESRSLATLERLVHYKRFYHLAPHVIFEVDVPDSEIETVLAFPKGWDGDDLLPAAQAIGNTWLDKAKSPALQVPSAVTPGEHNLLLNTRHSAWSWRWVIAGPMPFRFDARLVALISSPPKS
jgi:RES domain-containing protein